MEKYKVIGMIGEGSFGRVYKAQKKIDCRLVALKLITKYGRSEKEISCLRKECEIQRQLNHPNIIRMLDAFETENEIAVVTEFAGFDLCHLLRSEGFLNELRAKKVICNLISALYYLHSHRVLHRDLKPQNVLISNGLAKLCDFGFARNMSVGTHVLTSIKGTPLYMAPELIEESPYDHNADLWSLGCIAYEMLIGAPPFITKSILHLIQLIRYEPVKWPAFLSEDCLSLLKGLLNKDPNQRLSWPYLLDHPFVKGHILILNEQDVPVPLTAELTSSQALAKENQIHSHVMKTAQNNILAQAVKILQDQEARGSKRKAVGAGGIDRLALGVRHLAVTDGKLNENNSSGCRKPEESESDREWKESVGWECSSTVEPDEWLVFLEQSLEELMEGDLDSITQPGFITMVCRALNSSSPNVIEYIASLFSLPFVLPDVSDTHLQNLMRVYADGFIVPKLVYSCKLLLSRNDIETSESSVLLEALGSVFLLITHLVFKETLFLQQLCSSIMNLNACRLLTFVLSLKRRKPQLATDLVAIFCKMLCETPQYFGILKEVIYGFDHPESELRSLLTHSSDVLRSRTLTLVKLMGEHCPETLQSVWSGTLQNDIEALTYDSSQDVRAVAEDALLLLRTLPFYVPTFKT